MKHITILTALIRRWFSRPALVCTLVLSLLFSEGLQRVVNAQDATNAGVACVTSGTDVFFGGNFTNTAAGVTENGGSIQINANWVNNGVYLDTAGTVILSGADQDLTGASSTTFNNLALQGTGVKTMALDATVSGILSLNDRELGTGGNTLFILNPDTGSVTRTSGFVSSLGSGCISRKTNGLENYLFPTGSSVGTQRYRPVIITPNSVSTHTFSVRLANGDATSDGFDRSLKDSTISMVNPDYYHRINRTMGTSPADVSIYFDDLLDSTYLGISHWQTLPIWENTGVVTTVNSISPLLSFITLPAWDDFSYAPFALAIIPDAVTLTMANNMICQYDSAVFSVTGGYVNYAFYVNSLLVQSGSDSTFSSDSLSDGDTVLTEVLNGLGDTSHSNQIVIIVDPTYSTPVSEIICANDSIFLGGTYQNTAGVYHDTLSSITGCDSLIVTTLSINLVSVTALSTSICPGDSIMLGGSYQNASGIYYDTVIAINGCDSVLATTLMVINGMSITFSASPASCDAVSDAALTAIVSGGNSPYSYLWSDGQTNSSATGLSSGVYSIIISDSNGCIANDSSMVTALNDLSAIITGITDASCISICDGIASAFATGGTAPYTYNWDDPWLQTSSIANTLCVGINNVVVTDSKGCIDTTTATIGSPAEMELVITTTSSTCNNSDGSATVSITNGTVPFTYYWSSGDTLATADSLSSGIYIVTVIDDKGCSTFAAGTVSDLNGPDINVLTSSDITCNAAADGIIGVSVTGGTVPYIYQWSNGSDANFIYDLVAGPYELTVIDSLGCQAITSLTLNQPEALSLTVTTTDADCSNATGAGTVGVTGGTGGYNYLWSSGGTSNTELGLLADIYSVTVTDGNACEDSINVAISSIGGASILVDSIIDGDCGADLGAVYVTISGGAPPYNYMWSDSSTSEDLIDVSSGIYNVTVSDSSGCIASASVTIHGVPATNQEICMVTVDTTSGKNLVVWEKSQTQGVMSYNIYKESTQVGVYYLIGNVPVTDLSVFVDSLSNAMQRSWRYKIAVLDSCGNESALSLDHKTMHLTLNIGLGNTINLIWDHYLGFNFTTYYIYRYSTPAGWEKIDSLASNLTSYTDFSPPQSDLYYQVVVEHPTGCVATKQKNYNSSKSNTSSITFSESSLTASATSLDATVSICDGSAVVTPTGGTAPYTYLWDDLNSQTTATATGLCGNQTYTVLVLDNAGDTVLVSAFVGEIVGIADKNSKDELLIYPNPNRGIFKIELRDDIGAIPEDISIYDILGQRLRPVIEQLQSASGRHEVLIDLSDQTPGIYFLHIANDENTAIRKIIIE